MALVKLEGNNPAGSVKARPALSMIRRAEARGVITRTVFDIETIPYMGAGRTNCTGSPTCSCVLLLLGGEESHVAIAACPFAVRVELHLRVEFKS